jgi:hypothetical protein
MRHKKRKLKDLNSPDGPIQVRQQPDLKEKHNNNPRNLPIDNAGTEPDQSRSEWSNADLRKDHTEDLPD